MRVMLVGREPDRDRVRPQLVRAGFVIVSEAASAPAGASTPDGVDVDAVVHALDTGLAPCAGMPISDDPVAEALTAREREVLSLVAEGLSNKAIAATLGISDQTVKFHVAAISGKLGAANRTETVRLAVRLGLVIL